MANPIILNLTEDETKTGFEVAPAGVYKLEIEEAELTKSKAGNDMYKLTLRSLEEDYKGKFFTNVTLTAKAARFGLIPLMKALGHEVVAGALPVPSEDELIGKEVIAKVGISYSYKDESGAWNNVKTEAEAEELEKEGIQVNKRNEVDGRSYAPVAGGTKKKAGAKSSKFTL